MRRSWKKLTALALILHMGFLPLLGCSSGSSSGQGAAAEASPNQLYYTALADNLSLEHASAQLPDQLFASVKHFDLVQSVEPALFSADNGPGYVIYQPASARAPEAGVRPLALAPEGDGIPGFKSGEDIPEACRGVAAEILRDCLENEDIDYTPTTVHSSHLDAQALATIFDGNFADALVDRIIEAKLAHIDSAARAQIAAQLNAYLDDLPAHAALDLAEHQIFDRSGYRLVGATLTDDSQGDTNGDGQLERHSTLKIQISKDLDYSRGSHSEIDAIFLDYLGFVPQESYQINLQILIHLSSLHELRQQVEPAAGDAPMTLEDELGQLEEQWQASWLNKSLDANILRHIVEREETLGWESCEYSLSFQVSPDTIVEHLTPILDAALQRGDAYAHNLIEHHINAQTAIITGGSAGRDTGDGGAPVAATLGENPAPRLQVYYQVSRPRVGGIALFGSNKTSISANGWDYVMLDAAGNRMAIRDPASGKVLMAEEPDLLSNSQEPSIQPMWTKNGACKGNKGDWAYWPSRVRTGNFGRGINWILTESLLHNQVGDYKNIRWYQSLWKSSAQVAIKSGMWVVKNYLKVQLGAAGMSQTKYDYALYFILEEVFPMLLRGLAEDVGKLSKENGHDDIGNIAGKSFKIAGYGFQVSSRVLRFFWEASLYSKDQTFAGKAGTVIKGAAIGFMIDRVADGLGQTLDVTVTGWQDYSDSSHYGCFAFSY